MRVRIAGYRSLAYTPEFVAEALGFFRDEGLELAHVPSRPGFGLISAVREREADLAVGNAWFCLRYAASDERILGIAQINQQCRYSLVGRPGESERPFSWASLRGRTVLVAADAPTPWVALRQALTQNEVSLDDVNLIAGLAARDAISEFSEGYGDLLLCDLEVALVEGFEERGTIAAAIGPIPWSLVCASERLVDRERSAVQATRRALGRGQEWVLAEDAEHTAEVLRETVPEISDEERRRIIARYLHLGLWVPEPAVVRDQVRTWQLSLQRFGLLPEEVPLDGLFPFDEPE